MVSKFLPFIQQTAELSQQRPRLRIPAENLTHVVQKGDTLWNISQRYSTQIEKIKLKNKLENDLIVIGQKLMIDT